MAGAFEGAARAAIQELIQTHAQASKFGYVLTHDGVEDLTNSLYDLLVTSRTLKAAGDRFLHAGGGTPGDKASARPTPTRPKSRL